MSRTFKLGLAVPLFCSILLFPQATPPTSQKPQPSVNSATETNKALTDEADNPIPPQEIEALERKHADEAIKADHGDHTISGGQIDVLSDTMGIDFKPYLAMVLHRIRFNWYNLIPEVARAPIMKKGRVTIEFSILKDGGIGALKRVESSGDVSMDRAAWGGITASHAFPALPSEFKGKYLALRFHFMYNPDKNSLSDSSDRTLQSDSSDKTSQFYSPVMPIAFNQSLNMSASGTVKIAMKLAAGASQQFSVTSGDFSDKRVLWSVSGTGCIESACGTISDTGLYTAPATIPTPASVVVKATLAADPIRTASATVTIVSNSTLATSH